MVEDVISSTVSSELVSFAYSPLLGDSGISVCRCSVVDEVSSSLSGVSCDSGSGTRSDIRFKANLYWSLGAEGSGCAAFSESSLSLVASSSCSVRIELLISNVLARQNP